jgi:uncharacterized membrane protein YqgA involved in biofilm formation
MRGLGTLLNLATVLTGGVVGLFLGDRIPERMRQTVMQGVGLTTLAVAIVGFAPLADSDEGLKRFVILIASMILGAVIGELLRLEERLENVGDRLRRRLGVAEPETGADASRAEHSRFVEGFVVASTVFCVGPLTLLGGVEDGLGISIRLLAIKSTLDGFVAIGFAAVYGWGALASLVTIAVYQGGVTLFAALIEPALTAEVLAELGAVGSLLVFGIGLRLLDIKQVPVVNLMPALILAPAIAGAWETLVG